jgi:hypothetical protein
MIVAEKQHVHIYFVAQIVAIVVLQYKKILRNYFKHLELVNSHLGFLMGCFFLTDRRSLVFTNTAD